MVDRMTEQSLRTCAVLACLLLLSVGSLVAAQEPAGDFQLSLMRQYGRHIFSDCRVDLTVSQGRGVAALHCNYSGSDSKGRPMPALHAREELAAAESRRLADLVRASALYGGEHIGTDDTAADGTFEVVKLRSSGRAVMVVTSGNPTFERDESRRRLLASLRALEKRLADAAHRGK